MSALSDDRKAMSAAFKSAAAAAGVSQGGSWLAVLDDLHIVSGISLPQLKPETDGTRLATIYFRAKPVVLDPLLWRTLDKTTNMGTPKKQIMLRVMGAFSVDGVDVGWKSFVVSGPGVDLQAEAALVVEALLEEAAAFRRNVPDLAAFATRLDELRAERPALPFVHRLGRALTAVAIGDVATARRLIEEALANGETRFIIGGASIWQLLEADLRAGTGVFAT